MPFSADAIGVQSWCFREFKERKQLIAQVTGCGLSRVELCGVHADFANEATFDATIAELRAGGISIDSIGVQHFSGDEAKERKYFEFAKRAGAKTISADFKPDFALAGFRSAEKFAKEYGIRVAIHNHGGRHWLGNAQMLDAVFANTSDSIGLCLDTAWAMDAGEDPVALVTRYAKRLYGLHIKDFAFDRARRPDDVVAGTGNLDCAKLVAALRAADFSGYSVIEYEADVKDPGPAIAKCVAAVKAATNANAKQEKSHAR
ncbi:MAG: sugar phosphate isomerase/epimerase [Planctomycetes bacterium]|nr:sugar phosphate isomerase/epimerase [Planctomycetota bacterium]